MQSAVGSRQLRVQFSVGAVISSAQLCAPIAAQQVPKGQMPSLGRPTETGDAVPLFDFETYFLGKWSFEWSMPESALGPAGPYSGTTTVSKLDGRFYEAVSEGEGPAGPFKVREVIAYHRENKMLARHGDGLTRLQLFPVGSGRRRPGRDLQHPFRERTVHRQRQVGPPASHAAFAVATQLSNGDGDLGGWRSLQESRDAVVAEEP